MADDRYPLIQEYFRYTSEVFPQMAAEQGWLPHEEAHFQRIILDHVCGGVWYGKLKEPAILHLSKSQLKKAVRLCERIASGQVDIEELNEESLKWREEKGVPPDHDSYRARKEELEGA